jgi:arabinan endo-1,5-alpha-L-arabinosidase
MGRSKKVTGPFLDHVGVDMLQGGGKLFLGSSGRYIGPGHFGLLDQGDGAQFFSLHYEADLDRGGASVLDVRPLLWQDGWPVAGNNLQEGTYRIESARTGTDLELAVPGIPVGGGRARRGGGPGGGPAVGSANVPASTNAPAPGANRGGGGGGQRGAGGGGGGMFAGTGSGVIPPQDVAQVSSNWPSGNIEVRMANYMNQAQQQWTISAVTNAGGYLGAPYFKITIARTERTLAATEDGELVTLPAFTGGAEQLWRIEQLTDGTWRISPKSSSQSAQAVAVSALGSSFATLSKFDVQSDQHRWLIKSP